MLGCIVYAFADRGLRRKAKNKVILNINTSNSFRNSLSINLKTGLKYKGLLLDRKSTNNMSMSNNIASYQKGNTIYLLPHKQKILTPEIKQGYTGMKLILTSKN
jgi:uncharacterized protein YbaP (TraB family)